MSSVIKTCAVILIVVSQKWRSVTYIGVHGPELSKYHKTSAFLWPKEFSFWICNTGLGCDKAYGTRHFPYGYKLKEAETQVIS